MCASPIFGLVCLKVIVSTMFVYSIYAIYFQLTLCPYTISTFSTLIKVAEAWFGPLLLVPNISLHTDSC